MNKSYLPSKKIWILIGVILVIAGGIYFLMKDGQNQGDLVAQQGDEEIQFIDSDDDGLADWEEALWGTDPANPDTDDDGVNDGDEVAQGTHPKIPGPNDQIDQRYVDTVYSQDAEVRRNITEEAWENLLPYMASYVSVSDDGKEISQEQLDRISEEVSRQATEDEQERFSRSDLNINTQASFEDLDQYFVDYVGITNDYYANTEMEQELAIMGQATASSDLDEEMLVGLEVVANEYRSLANDLLEVSVPQSLATMHLEVINNYLGLAKATRDMSTLADDPVRAMTGLSRYQELMNINAEITNGLGQEIGRQARILLESA